MSIYIGLRMLPITSSHTVELVTKRYIFVVIGISCLEISLFNGSFEQSNFTDAFFSLFCLMSSVVVINIIHLYTILFILNDFCLYF